MSVIELSWTAKNSISVTDINIQSAVSVFFPFSESIQFWQHLLIILQFCKKGYPEQQFAKFDLQLQLLCKKIRNNDYQALQNYDPEQQFAKS